MRYVFASTGQQGEVPLLPGLALRGDAWYSRAATPGGFNKTQVLAQEWTMAHPSGGENRAATAKGSPRCASLLGASAAADEMLKRRAAGERRGAGRVHGVRG